MDSFGPARRLVAKRELCFSFDRESVTKAANRVIVAIDCDSAIAACSFVDDESPAICGKAHLDTAHDYLERGSALAGFIEAIRLHPLMSEAKISAFVETNCGMTCYFESLLEKMEIPFASHWTNREENDLLFDAAVKAKVNLLRDAIGVYSDEEEIRLFEWVFAPIAPKDEECSSHPIADDTFAYGFCKAVKEILSV